MQEALGELAGAAQEGLLALSVGVGLGLLSELMEEEVTEVFSPKGRHDPERTAVRHYLPSARHTKPTFGFSRPTGLTRALYWTRRAAPVGGGALKTEDWLGLANGRGRVLRFARSSSDRKDGGTET